MADEPDDGATAEGPDGSPTAEGPDAGTADEGPDGSPQADEPGRRPVASAAGRRLRVGVAAALRDVVRAPVTLALLLALPPVVVRGYGSAMAAFPELPFTSTDPATLGQVNGAVFAAAFLAGLVGLFQVISAARVDERLDVAGLPRWTLFAARLSAVAVVAVVASAVTLAVVWASVEPAAPVAALGALVLAGLCYGLLGMLVGALVPRELEGSLVLVFVADVDDALASGLVDVDSPLRRLLPLHYPHALFESAVVGGGVAGDHVLGGLAVLLALAVVALGTYLVVTGDGRGLP